MCHESIVSTGEETKLYLDGPPSTADGAKTVLIVDDEHSILTVLAAGLEIHGYVTRIASTGDHAEQILANEPIDLVLLDILLPERSGVELLKCFKDSYPDLPVIMITGCGRVHHAVECFKMGAIDLLAKPVMLDKLIPVVKKALTPIKPSERKMHDSIVPDVDGFRFIKILGEGSMGMVYQVESDGSNGPVIQYALKLFKQLDNVDPSTKKTLRERFEIEAKTTFSIQHPNVIQVYDYAADAHGVPYILMELFEGMLLKQLIRERHLSFREKYYILKQIAFALATIHDNDICHRDLKLSNIMIDDDLHVKIMDFGIARIKDSTLTPTKHVMGTPAYMSPEAFCSAKVDKRSDIFSFGSIAYEILTGKRAFKEPDIASLAYKIRFKDPVWPKKLGIDIPKKLETSLKIMMAKKPEKRTQSAYELYQLLSELTDSHLT